MKRISIYLLYSVVIIALVAIFDCAFQRKTALDYYHADFFQKAGRLKTEAYMARRIEGGIDDRNELRTYLDSRLRAGAIDFWIVIDGERMTTSRLNPTSLANVRKEDFDPPTAGKDVYADGNGQRYFAFEKLSHGEKLVVGLAYNETDFLTREWEAELGGLWRYLLGIFTICIGTFAFFFRDIMSAIRQLRGGRKKFYDVSSARSKEAELLVRGLSAFHAQNQQLEDDRDRYRLQILPSLRGELNSGLEPPYDFSCTLARTDINNYSHIYNTRPIAPFMATINEFFNEVAQIVSRYGGYIHEFIGDEVIYYFKDDEVGNSTAIALAAIRDINACAERVHQRTLKTARHPFTVKTSAANGRLRFGRLVNGHALSGPSFIETVRIVSTVTEKDGNVVVLDERHVGVVDFADAVDATFVDFKFYSESVLKGFTGVRRLFACDSFRSVHTYFKWDAAKTWRALEFYRNDADMTETLNWLRATWSNAPHEDVVELLKKMSPMLMTGSNGQPLKALLDWIEALLMIETSTGASTDFSTNALADASPTSSNESAVGQFAEMSRILASALRLIENFAAESTDKEPRLLQLIEKATSHADARVAANAVEVISRLRLQPGDRMQDLIEHFNNRLAANSVVCAGQRDVDARVLKALLRMLHSSQAARVASGLYALGEIAAYHLRRDPVYFRTQLELSDLIDALPGFMSHTDVAVRRQAAAAASKIGSHESSAKKPA